MSEPKTFLLGMNAKAYFGAVGAELDAMTELTNVTDVTCNFQTGEADITTRGNSGWRATAATLKEGSVDFQMVWKPGDDGFEAVRDAWLNSTTLEMAFLDQDRDTAGAQGPKGAWSVTNFSRSEPLEEAIKADVTVKLADFDEWVEVAGS